MWYLKSENDNKILYVVPQKKEITIGRSPDTSICDFAIQDDPSISRKHAVLMNLENNFYVKDLGSRYGTFVNNTKIENINVKLNNNDVVKFGKMGSVWNVHSANFVTCTSTLKGENLTNLKLVLQKIGGLLKNDWDDTCKYLTMPAITLTIKVVLALVQGSHIVTTQFWNACLTAITNNEALPEPNNYTPEIVESTLNKDAVSFLPASQRRVLFAGKKFIFFSKRQYDMYKPVLLKGAANPLLLSESKFTKAMLSEDDVVVIQYNITSTSQETEAQKNQINEIVSYLKTHGKRVIADAEIGLAILYVSTEKYCNPAFNFSSEVVRQAPTQQITKVLAQETQEQSGTLTKKDNVIINESLTSNDGNSSKRKLGEDMETSVNKKLATSVNKTSHENAKRKHDDDGTNNPTKKMAMDNEDDLFNFITPGSNDISNKTKSADKLNLAKPLKRKAGIDPNEDNLFNFVQNDVENDSPSGMFEVGEGGTAKKNKTEQVEDISVLRGSKLEELKKINENWNSNILKPHNIKKEVNDELDEKMNLLDIGSVVVTIKENLIIKKEPLEVEARDNNLKNFKKFKKVWPVKMQVTIIPKSSMSIVKTNDSTHEASLNKATENGDAEDSSMNVVTADIPQESSTTITE